MKFEKALAAALLAAFFFQGFFLIRRTSPTADEIAFHMVNGYAYLNTRDYRMSPANPALAREWMALPWLALRPRLDLDKPSWREADSVPFALEFFYRDNRPMAETLLFSSRFMILLLGTWLGWLIFRWSRALYGPAGGLTSLSLYAFCPVLLGHSAIAHTDIAVSAFLCAAAFALWRFLEGGSARDRLLFCVWFGLAAAAKYHALFFGPLFLAVIAVRRGFRDFGSAAWRLALLSLAVIWASYLFDVKPLLADGVPRIPEKLAMLPEILRGAALHFPIPAPAYWMGLGAILTSHREPYWHYAFGEWGTRHHWYFYFVSFAVKMTLPFLIALAARFFVRNARAGANAPWVLLLPAAAWFAALSFDSTGVGVRYLFPVLPLLIVWMGGLAPAALKKKAAAALLAAALVWNAGECLTALPNALSYFNEAAGGVRGGMQLVRGSDVDWGQGLKELKRHLDAHGGPKVSLRYFGTAEPAFYGIDFEPIRDEELLVPARKLYAIGLFYLEHAQWTKGRKPDAVVGGSIALYDFRK